MPREVFAEEIEAFLERLETVAAARVVATEAGEIDRIYVTTESPRDDASIRRTITSALMSQYSLHMDGWRVQIAHLEPTPEPEPIPDCHLARLEETVTETLTRVVVDLRYVRDGSNKTTSGSAQAPPGQAHRLRTVALATIDALRPLVERAGHRPALEGLSLMPFAGATVALAAVSLASERVVLLRVGAETVTAGQAEAVVGAVIDAVRRPIRPAAQPGAPRPDRHRQFEGVRRHYERLLHAGAPGGELPAPQEVRPVAPEAPPSWGAGAQGPEPSEEMPEGDEGPGLRTHPAPEDVIQSMAEIRPEHEGGATVMREETRESGPAGRPVPRASMEEAFYRRLVTTGAPVHIRCRDGYEIPHATVREFGTYSLLVEANGVQELVFKHGIIAIRPHGPLPPEGFTPPS